MFKENPQSVDDKEAVAMKLSEEWRQIKSNMQQEIPKSNTNVSHTLIGEIKEDYDDWRPEHGKPKKWCHAYLQFVKLKKAELSKEVPGGTFKEMS